MGAGANGAAVHGAEQAWAGLAIAPMGAAQAPS
jgi:hypothetical protein